MFDIFFIGCLFSFSGLCFFEFFVFNEEALLALCFFCFIFFSFNSLGDTVVDIFQSRASKFEADLLISFNLVKDITLRLFDNFFVSRGFGLKFKIFAVIISNYLNLFTGYASFKRARLVYTSTLLKLAEFFSFESNLIQTFQTKSVSLLLYPLIFKTAKPNLSLGLNVGKILATCKTQIRILKFIS